VRLSTGDRLWARSSLVLAWAVAASVAAFALSPFAIMRLRERSAPLAPMTIAIDIPGELARPSGGPSQLAVSPNGQYLAFTAQGPEGVRLWLRAMHNPVPRSLPGTDDAISPFWSPDSQNVGFFSGSKLKRVNVGSGTVQMICDFANTGSMGGVPGQSGAWSHNGTIVFKPGGARYGLFSVPASGGTVTPVSRPAENEIAQSKPEFLDDNRFFS
jgi:hypothetical protein